MADEVSILTFKQVTAVLAESFGLAPAKMPTFVGRLQQLQRLGLPTGTNVGRSARAAYQGWHLAELGFYLELLDVAVTPAVIQAHFSEFPFFRQTNLGIAVERAEGLGQVVIQVELSILDNLRIRPRKALYAQDTPYEIEVRNGLRGLYRSSTNIQINLTSRLKSLRKAMLAIVPNAEQISFGSDRTNQPFELPDEEHGVIILGRVR